MNLIRQKTTWRCWFSAVLLMSSQVSLAETGSVKSWYYDTNGHEDGSGFNVAGNYPEGGSYSFGQYCFLEMESCMYLANLAVECNEDSDYPGIVNSDAGVIAVTLGCMELNDEYYLSLSPFDDVDGLVREGSKLGIVLPLQDDEFKVVRFSLSGSAYAIDLMRAASESQMTESEAKKVPTAEIL